MIISYCFLKNSEEELSICIYIYIYIYMYLSLSLSLYIYMLMSVCIKHHQWQLAVAQEAVDACVRQQERDRGRERYRETEREIEKRQEKEDEKMATKTMSYETVQLKPLMKRDMAQPSKKHIKHKYWVARSPDESRSMNCWAVLWYLSSFLLLPRTMFFMWMLQQTVFLLAGDFTALKQRDREIERERKKERERERET